jgi:hypothetical protein
MKMMMLRLGPILTSGEEDSINTAKKGLIKYFCFIIQNLIVVALYRILYLVFEDAEDVSRSSTSHIISIFLLFPSNLLLIYGISSSLKKALDIAEVHNVALSQEQDSSTIIDD